MLHSHAVSASSSGGIKLVRIILSPVFPTEKAGEKLVRTAAELGKANKRDEGANEYGGQRICEEN